MPIRERVSALNEERSKRLQAEATVAQLQAQLQAAIEQAGTCELNLIESDRLAALGLLTAGIAHELNSPLGYVSSNVSSLQEYLQELQQHVSSARTFLDELDEPGIQTGRVAAGLRELLDNQLGTLLEDATDTLQDTLEGTRRIAGIVGGLRDYSRYDDDWDMANIVACLKSTLKLARNEFKSGCKLVVQVSKLPDSYFNHGKLAQVFLNLLVNAGHAVDEQGLVKVSCAQHGDTAVIEVSDNGCGIAEEVLERVFEPFFTTKPRGLGTGLGLSISRSIVDAHGGKLTASSQLGFGTTFRVELPLHAQLPTYDSESPQRL